MTLDHMGAISIINDSLLKQTPIYRWLKNRPTEKQALHNIRLTFKAAGVWNVFSTIYPDKINSANKDVKLPTSNFFDYIDLTVTIHHTDTVSVAISCSFRPIVIDLKDFLQLFEALTRTEINLTNIIEKSGYSSTVAAILPYRQCIVKMWHFGVDTIDEYTGRESEVTRRRYVRSIQDLY
jgi:hypothetical protein